ncbi:hypothetical protein [Parendozoicomonas haliclonae]|uniref:Uncharacterized protein n=1 Tax=Parendozoicomonas haliclonae TaxID=1960125 RepID=A0A1X7AJZ0_9GAMM|nr:hypothetical protein [Parendozoicomonas haliclonae]SMA47391.1 hypothetical protein EHSB41UT_02401 [Parendozoicomonas haliclonae]
MNQPDEHQQQIKDLQQELKALKEKDASDEKEHNQALGGLMWFVTAPVLALPCLYWFWFGGFKYFNFSKNPEHWGWFGDFLGGSLNPLLSFFTVILLLLSLSQTRQMLRQNKEEMLVSRQQNEHALAQGRMALENNRYELELTRKEVAASSEALKLQVKAMEEQKKQDEEHYLRGLHHQAVKDATEVLRKAIETPCGWYIPTRGNLDKGETRAVGFKTLISPRSDANSFFILSSIPEESKSEFDDVILDPLIDFAFVVNKARQHCQDDPIIEGYVSSLEKLFITAIELGFLGKKGENIWYQEAIAEAFGVNFLQVLHHDELIEAEETSAHI